MEFTARIRKHGTSKAITIPKELTVKLNISEGDIIILNYLKHIEVPKNTSEKNKMETKVTHKEGVDYTTYKPEAGDVFTSRFSNVGTNDKGQYINHFLGVTTEDGREINLKITAGQKTVLDEKGDLKGKKISFKGYTNDHGNQIGIDKVE